jgi:hypothetical protein
MAMLASVSRDLKRRGAQSEIMAARLAGTHTSGNGMKAFVGGQKTWEMMMTTLKY